MAREASVVFDHLVQQIQDSHLNFRLELSPFSANISLRKSFIRDKSGTPILPRSFEYLPATEKFEVDDKDATIRELKVKLDQLENVNAALTRNYEEETSESETLKYELNETLARLDNLQGKFVRVELALDKLKDVKKQLETKHEKTCVELKDIKSEVDDLVKELAQSSVVIKTMKKEMKESDTQHQKAARKKDSIIEDLLRYKSLKESEEKDLKVREKKLNKKAKTLDERETKLNTKKKELNKKEILTEDPGNNNNAREDTTTSFEFNFEESITMTTYNHISSNIDNFPSVVSHWLPPPVTPQLVTPLTARPPPPPVTAPSCQPILEADSISRKRRIPRLWQCDYCEQSYPWGYTLDQAMHMVKHKRKN